MSFKFVKGAKNSVPADDEIWVDTGGGEFDHHVTSDYVNASFLVAEKFGLIENEAIKRIVDFGLKVDHGEYFDIDLNFTDLTYIILGLNHLFPDKPIKVIEVIFNNFDALHAFIEKELIDEKSIQQRIEFETSVGKCLAIDLDSQSIRDWSYRNGFRLFIYKDRDTGYIGIKANGSDKDIDLTPVYQTLSKNEPDKEWFLHASKQLVLCGTRKVPTNAPSELALNDLISLVKMSL